MTTTPDLTWTVWQDQNDDDGIVVKCTEAENAALLKWYGKNTGIYLPDLRSPTFAEFGESKSDAKSAITQAIQRYYAEGNP